MEIKINIPVKPMVKAYLENNFGKNGVIKLTRENRIGKYFYTLTERPYSYQDHLYTEYKDHVVIVIQEDLFTRHGFNMPKTCVMDFNNYITETVYSLLFFYLEMHDELSSEPYRMKDAIVKFCTKFNFTEEILSYETAKKAFYRHRLRKEELLNKE